MRQSRPSSNSSERVRMDPLRPPMIRAQRPPRAATPFTWRWIRFTECAQPDLRHNHARAGWLSLSEMSCNTKESANRKRPVHFNNASKYVEPGPGLSLCLEEARETIDFIRRTSLRTTLARLAEMMGSLSITSTPPQLVANSPRGDGVATSTNIVSQFIDQRLSFPIDVNLVSTSPPPGSS